MIDNIFAHELMAAWEGNPCCENLLFLGQRFASLIFFKKGIKNHCYSDLNWLLSPPFWKYKKQNFYFIYFKINITGFG